MREIKFRGQRIDTKEWVYGNYVYDEIVDESFIYFKELGYPEGVYPNEFIVKIEVSTDTVGQFTGLQDNNKKDIYEGDVVKTKEGLKQVIFDEGSFILADNYVNTEKMTFYTGQIISKFMQSDLEVIGNVYENKIEELKLENIQ